VKSTNTRFIVVLLAFMLVLGACKRDATATGDQATETIAPAAPQPAPTGTDAMTQTVDIEEGRTDAEGGTQTAAGAALDTTAGGTAGTTAPPTPATTTSTTTR
jgi:hypothetical protein